MRKPVPLYQVSQVILMLAEIEKHWASSAQTLCWHFFCELYRFQPLTCSVFTFFSILFKWIPIAFLFTNE